MFVVISGLGAFLEEKGLGKGLIQQPDMRPQIDGKTKFKDVKGVDEAKVFSSCFRIACYVNLPVHPKKDLIGRRKRQSADFLKSITLLWHTNYLNHMLEAFMMANLIGITYFFGQIAKQNAACRALICFL